MVINSQITGNPYKCTVMDNGTRIITEYMENVRSVAVGLWFVVGSRDENQRQAGLSHFLEHMMFKGTKKRSALSIASEIEHVGGHLNAFTTKEITAYYAHLLDERLLLAVDVLCDMASNSKFLEKEIRREQGVVLEEISTSEDTPEDVIHEDFAARLFPKNSLGRPILGSKKSVASFSRKEVQEYWAERYTPGKLVIAAAGRVDHDKLVKLVEKKLNLPSSNAKKRKKFKGIDPTVEDFTRKKEIMQAHLCLGTRGISFSDPRRFSFLLMNTVLGAGMSSRLFQRIRERNGLAYSIYSFHEAYSDTGMFGIYAGTEEKHVPRAVDLIRKEIDKLINKPLSKSELARVKTQLKGGLMLGLESVASRMNRLARMEIYLGEYMPIDDLLVHIDSVTAEDIQKVASDFFGNGLYASYLLPSNSNSK